MENLTQEWWNEKYSKAIDLIDKQRQKIELLETQNKGLRDGLLEYLIAIEAGQQTTPVTEAEKLKLRQTIIALQSIQS